MVDVPLPKHAGKIAVLLLEYIPFLKKSRNHLWTNVALVFEPF